MMLWDVSRLQESGTGLRRPTSFRLGSTATCHSSPARNHSISSEGHQDGGPYFERARESLLLRAPSPGTLFLSITSQTLDTLSHLAEALAIMCFCRINRQQPSQKPNLIFPKFTFKCFEVEVLLQWLAIACSASVPRLRAQSEYLNSRHHVSLIALFLWNLKLDA